MALDGIYTHYLIKELHETLEKSRLESITQSGLRFCLSLYKEKQRHFLIINLNASFTSAYLTNNPIKKGDTTNFSNQLKKYLQGGILESIEQYRTDRVFIFNFTVYDYIEGPTHKQLIFEAMGRHANLYLLDKQIIIDAYKKMFVLDGRHLVTHAQFDYFKSDKLDATLYQYDALQTPKEITQKYLGISLRLAQYLTEHRINPFQIQVQPTLSLNQNKTYFFNLFDDEVQYFNTLSEALDQRIMDIKDLKTPYINFIEKEIKKFEKKVHLLNHQLEQAHLNLSYKDQGDMIYASGMNLNLKIGWIDKIALDETKTLSQNAQEFYKLYHKSKRSIDYIEAEIHKFSSMIETLKNYLNELDLSIDEEINQFDELLEPFGFLKKRRISSKKNQKHKIKLLTLNDEDSTYIIGKNALQNALLMNEIGKRTDYWFHLKDAPGSHVLLRTERLTEKNIRRASMLAAYFSTFKNSSSIPINYTEFKYVSKISGMPASFVKIKNEKTIFIDIDESFVNSILKNA